MNPDRSDRLQRRGTGATMRLVVEHKDVVLAILGAASGLGALVLVFLGVLVTTLQGFDSETPGAVLTPYRVVATETVAAFVLSILSVGMCIWWLAGSQSRVPYVLTLVAFVAVLPLLLAAAGWVAWKLVLGK